MMMIRVVMFFPQQQQQTSHHHHQSSSQQEEEKRKKRREGSDKEREREGQFFGAARHHNTRGRDRGRGRGRGSPSVNRSMCRGRLLPAPASASVLLLPLLLLLLLGLATAASGAASARETQTQTQTQTGVNNNRLLNAINADDEQRLREVLQATSPKQLNKRGSGGQTPLMFAAMSGKEKSVPLLLAAGADFSIGDDTGYTPMHGAAFHGQSAIVLSLIEHGVPFLKEFHKDGRTPFHRACWGESKAHAQTVKIFLEAGADVDTLTKDGKLCSQLTSNRRTQKALRRFRMKQKGHLYRNANSEDVLLFSPNGFEDNKKEQTQSKEDL